MGFTLGAADYLTKPVDQQRLVSIIRRHCNRQSRSPVLIIEDDDSSRQLMAGMLEKEGVNVVAVEDAESGLALLAEQEPALILLDLILPGLDGFQFIEAVHENERWRNIPIVVVTAKDLSPQEHEFLNQSAQKIMKKGVYNRDDLLDIVRATMRRRVLDEEPAVH
jgi:DNA-binding response OmpR family regulator